ncbi:mitotic deacetylase associated SANT domain protein a isoform X2 [Rhinichthys klamathensis goyatoka]|uniref:mitotic deacetylase associated SANT domain protein a isoform X2 n=1 Tax=Rhinichthys klamathensis goyatoka TaxID=3034132 RepID=UPI0024B5A2A9|nr:mitotic deacetylase associated SANT domain protein a isoform X2 [Rhinichthys klamathensis goyatoka]
MSLSPHQRGTINSISKQNVEAIGETMQHSGDLFYNVGAPSLEQTHSSPEGLVDSSPEVQGAFKSDKGYPVRGHFQQSGPVKWVHQDPVQTSTWFQGLPNMKWSQNFGPSLSAIDDPRAFHKSHEMEAMKLEKLSPGSSQSYTDTSHVPGADWDHHTMAVMHHAQFQALQQGHIPADLQYQPQGMNHDMTDSTLQPFQLAFGPTKQPQATGFQQVFQGNNASLNMNYNEKPKSQQQLLQLQQQQLHRQHQMQQLQQMRQLQQQQQQQNQIQQQQRLHQMQQQYHQQKKRQEQMQQQQLQLQQHGQGFQHLDSIEKQRAKQEIESQDLPSAQVKIELSQTQLTVPQPQHLVPQESNYQESGPAEPTPDLQETQTKRQVLPRRSRRLSKDGISPQGDQPSKDKVSSQNGGVGGVQGPTVGVIQSTQRRRRASKEINLETLAQKASEMEFLPAKCEDITPGRPAGMAPLVIPVSVPVRRCQTKMEVQGSWAQTDNVRNPSEVSHQQNQPDRKPSVIVARRHSLKNSASESFFQGTGQEDKSRRRPRPEPLVIPQPCTFIAPSVYSSITPYQSNLRSPVRLPDHASIIPPYTPPPILSPVREGSGLYSVLFLSSMSAGSQILPPPSTPRSNTRSLLRTSSSDISPPALPLFGEATPVSLEPRINIGSQYQAEIPELWDQTLALKDQHKATLVWLPNSEADSTASQDTRFDDLMNLVCSSVMCGGGTNPELAMHCLHECKGDVMQALEMMMMKNPIFSRNHHLANYHYAGSDCWTVDEKRFFNKGISAYRKDFFLVQKLVRTKTVAQCVEFYYTYKKQAKVGRNGTFTYGPSDPEESLPVMNVKEEENDSKHQEGTQDHVDERLQDVTKTLQDNENRADVAHEDQKNGSAKESSGLMPATQPSFKTPSPAPPKPRSDNTGKKNRASTVNKSQGEPEGIFPCKKCSRVFYKVKSRSAHMKSHSEQEKKAAALRQREEEERVAKAKQEMLEAAKRKEAQEGKKEESSGAEDSSAEPDDELDEDWH